MLSVFSRSDVVELPYRSEDGERIYRDVYYVLVRFPAGWTFCSERSFSSDRAGDARAAVEEYVLEVQDQCDKWNTTLGEMRRHPDFREVQAAYGSAAYVARGDEQTLIEMERKEDPLGPWRD